MAQTEHKDLLKYSDNDNELIEKDTARNEIEEEDHDFEDIFGISINE